MSEMVYMFGCFAFARYLVSNLLLYLWMGWKSSIKNLFMEFEPITLCISFHLSISPSPKNGKATCPEVVVDFSYSSWATIY